MRGISINDFTVAMETYGANRLENRSGSRYPISVPCFEAAGVAFMHSGSYYIVQRDRKVPVEIMNKAMAAFGEKHPGGKNFWWGETHSIPGILTLVSMLENTYSPELIKELTNKTYKKLLTTADIKSNVEFPFKELNTPKMKELRRQLYIYSNIVNPFGDSQLRMKDPIEYLNNVSINVSGPNADKNGVHLHLTGNSASSEYHKDDEGWSYHTSILMQKKRRNKSLSIGHYYNNGLDNRPIDEVVYVDYSDRGDSGYLNHHPDDLDLRISLNTGLAWKTYREELAEPATDEQLDIVISHLKDSIKKIKHRIVNKMIIME